MFLSNCCSPGGRCTSCFWCAWQSLGSHTLKSQCSATRWSFEQRVGFGAMHWRRTKDLAVFPNQIIRMHIPLVATTNKSGTIRVSSHLNGLQRVGEMPNLGCNMVFSWIFDIQVAWIDVHNNYKSLYFNAK